MPILTLAGEEPLNLQPAPSLLIRNFRGARIPGSEFYRVTREGFELFVQEYQTEYFALTCRSYQFQRETLLQTEEEMKGVRMEWIITGELPIGIQEEQRTLLRAGQYHLTNEQTFLSRFAAGSSCSYITLHYSTMLIGRLPINEPLKVEERLVRSLSPAMQTKIFGVLQNNYVDDLLDFCYDNFLRDMLLMHLGTEPATEPGGLSERDKAAIRELDNLIASDISRHWTMPLLARKAALNEYTLKKGFSQLFKMAPFERLLYYRMQVACPLLEQTNKPLKEIADLAGYRSEAGFVTGFKRWFKISPGEWRRRSREGGELPRHRFD